MLLPVPRLGAAATGRRAAAAKTAANDEASVACGGEEQAWPRGPALCSRWLWLGALHHL